jgi:predicted short-subunit dehydrogenase-like oxidoreductase (DUF2520 family)
VKFSIAGSGNVAHHFAEMLCRAGHQLVDVWSKTQSHGAELASIYGARLIDHPSGFSRENELIIIAVNDNSIEEVSGSIDPSLQTIHTSGAAPATILKQATHGVVWPVYSLTKGITADYASMPLIIESNQANFLEWLQQEFGMISSKVRSVSGDDRKKAHLAAVFANNFSNQMYDIAATLLEQSGLKFELLLPIIRQHTEKVSTVSPFEAQTGPARRADHVTIDAQLKLLSSDPEAATIYKNVTERILRKYHDKKL